MALDYRTWLHGFDVQFRDVDMHYIQHTHTLYTHFKIDCILFGVSYEGWIMDVIVCHSRFPHNKLVENTSNTLSVDGIDITIVWMRLKNCLTDLTAWTLQCWNVAHANVLYCCWHGACIQLDLHQSLKFKLQVQTIYTLRQPWIIVII